jgi:hypothetical protein
VILSHDPERKRERVQKDEHACAIQSFGKFIGRRLLLTEYEAVVGQIGTRYSIDEATRVNNRMSTAIRVLRGVGHRHLSALGTQVPLFRISGCQHGNPGRQGPVRVRQ